jgi:hypothetical protein
VPGSRTSAANQKDRPQKQVSGGAAVEGKRCHSLTHILRGVGLFTCIMHSSTPGR